MENKLSVLTDLWMNGSQIINIIAINSLCCVVVAGANLLFLYTVYTEDLMKNPAIELEKIITFAGVPVPDRPKLKMAGKQLQTLLHRYALAAPASIDNKHANGNHHSEADLYATMDWYKKYSYEILESLSNELLMPSASLLKEALIAYEEELQGTELLTQ